MDSAAKQQRVVVLGTGPGGYPAAFLAAELGMDVTTVDTEANPGGVCLYRGCIPSKALLHIAGLLSETREAEDWGVQFGSPKIDVEKLRDKKESIIGRLTGGLGQLRRSHKIKHVQGYGRFLDSHTLSVTAPDGGDQKVAFDYAIIATGSQPTRIPNLSIDSPRVMDSTDALALSEIPKSLLVIGGGYIGLELGCVYQALGAKVTAVEMTSGLLPGADRDLVEVLGSRLGDKFEEILLNTRVVELREQKNGIRAKLSGADLPKPERIFGKVLIAVGRKPNTADLGLAQTQVELDARGFIKVDLQRRSTESHIFGIGDVSGEPMLAHKASHEARVAVETIAGKASAFDPQAIPAVVFTDPELAWCGLTETQALEKGLEVKVTSFPWAASGRATTLGRNDGLTKLLIDPITQRVLGMGIAGVGAGDLIAEGALAIEMGAVAEDLKLTIHPHPTLSETVMEAADFFFGHSAHYRPKR